MEHAQMEITQIRVERRPLLGRTLARVLARKLARTLVRTAACAAGQFRVFWHSIAGSAGIKRKRKTLSVRETAALGDRRFVSVIQFERQRFLIGSSPTSVTLLSQLPDGSPSSEVTGEKL
jgi:hypothetical protein